jgi:hypothetical protein
MVISNELISVKVDKLMTSRLWNLVCGTFSGNSRYIFGNRIACEI